MNFGRRIGAAAALSLLALPAGAQPQTAATQPEAPLAPAAPATPPLKLKKKPAFLSGDQAEFPAEAKALGHHGTVIVAFEIDAAGTVIASSLRKGSGSDLLDASALSTARTARFSPAIDADGNAIPFKFQSPYEFSQARSGEPGGGLVHYRCDAFTRDMDWWDSTHPEVDGKGEQDEIYHMLLGLRVLTFPGGMMAGFKDGKVSKAHQADWENARKQCRANPDRLLVDFLGQREYILALSKSEAAKAKR